MLRWRITSLACEQSADSRGALSLCHLTRRNVDDGKMRKPRRIQVTQVRRGDANLRRTCRNRLDNQAPVTLIQLRQNIIEQEDWRLAGLRLQQIDFRKLRGDKSEPLLSS